MPPPDPSDEAAILDRLYDAYRLLALRRALREAADAPEPRAVMVAGPPIRPAATVALLPGSFNPPTVAHLALAKAGLEWGADAALFALATRTVDKEVVTGAALEDRLLLLELLAARDRRLGALLVNRGLYVDQAVAVRAAFPEIREVVFLVGHDKILQIFDPRYYDDRDAALERLFGLARFLVAPRADAGPEELGELLERPENRRFASAVRPLDLPPSLRDVASSAVRSRAAEATAGRPDVSATPADPGPTDQADARPGDSRAGHDDLPPECRAFVDETAAYAPEPATAKYRRRLELLDELEALAASGAADAELRARLRAAMKATLPRRQSDGEAPLPPCPPALGGRGVLPPERQC